jgi:hypothetical protein
MGIGVALSWYSALPNLSLPEMVLKQSNRGRSGSRRNGGDINAGNY